jgi:hypothetical protein
LDQERNEKLTETQTILKETAQIKQAEKMQKEIEKDEWVLEGLFEMFSFFILNVLCLFIVYLLFCLLHRQQIYFIILFILIFAFQFRKNEKARYEKRT